MTGFKRSKQSRARGSWTHGWGAKKKHRGAGHRGGRGRAGSGKRGDAKKPMYWTEKDFYKKRGFSSKSRNVVTTVNVAELCTNIDMFVENKMATVTAGVYTVNLTELGCNKLLGSGKIDKKIQINVEIATKKAIAKVEAVGGKVILPSDLPADSADSAE